MKAPSPLKPAHLRERFSWDVLDPKTLPELHHHKYSGQDDSLLAYYVLQPYWNFVVKFVPSWVAPNLITLVGLLSTFTSLLIASSYSKGSLQVQLEPWMYASTGGTLFMYQTLDAIDGKHARNTGSSSPLGELFDHGCDALNSSVSIIDRR